MEELTQTPEKRKSYKSVQEMVNDISESWTFKLQFAWILFKRRFHRCPYKAECMSLVGQPIGMHHCEYCGEMVIAGMDPTGFCSYEDKRSFFVRVKDWFKERCRGNKNKQGGTNG